MTNIIRISQQITQTMAEPKGVDLGSAISDYLKRSNLEEYPPPISPQEQVQRNKRRLVVILSLIFPVMIAVGVFLYVRHRQYQASIVQSKCPFKSKTGFTCTTRNCPVVTLKNPFVGQQVSKPTLVIAPANSCVSYMTGQPGYLQTGVVPNRGDKGNVSPTSSVYANMDIVNPLLSLDGTICYGLDGNWQMLNSANSLNTSNTINFFRPSNIPVGWVSMGDVCSGYASRSFALVPLYWTIQGCLTTNLAVGCTDSAPPIHAIVPFGVINADTQTTQPSGASTPIYPGPLRCNSGITGYNYDELTRLPRDGDIVVSTIKLVVTDGNVTLGDLLSYLDMSNYDIPYLQAINNNQNGSFFQGKPTQFFTPNMNVSVGAWFYAGSLPQGYTRPRKNAFSSNQ